MSDSKLLVRDDVKLEICVDSLDGVRIATASGVDRIELCGQLELGGVTPSHGLFAAAREATSLDIRVLVRPRAGDFVYSPDELDVMRRDLEHFRTGGAQGAVFGALEERGDVDRSAMESLLDATDLPITFHRAFDVARDPQEAFGTLLELQRHSPQLTRLLTSGQALDPLEAAPLLRRLVERGGEDLIVLVGGGLREGTLREVGVATGAREFHFSASRHRPGEFEPGLDVPPRYTCKARVAAYLREFQLS